MTKNEQSSPSGAQQKLSDLIAFVKMDIYEDSSRSDIYSNNSDDEFSVYGVGDTYQPQEPESDDPQKYLAGLVSSVASDLSKQITTDLKEITEEGNKICRGIKDHLFKKSSPTAFHTPKNIVKKQELDMEYHDRRVLRVNRRKPIQRLSL